MARSIQEIEPGDYVRDADRVLHEIAEIHGVSPTGQLAAPSAGGFYVITCAGRKIDMWHAHSYHKRADVPEGERP